MTSAEFAESIRHKIWDNRTFTDYRYYGDFYSNSSRQGTTHFSVIAENGDAVSATTTINYLWVFTRKQKEKQCREHSPPSSSYLINFFYFLFQLRLTISINSHGHHLQQRDGRLFDSRWKELLWSRTFRVEHDSAWQTAPVLDRAYDIFGPGWRGPVGYRSFWWDENNHCHFFGKQWLGHL